MNSVIKMNNMWDYALTEFGMHYPHLIDSVVDWYPCGQMEITIKLSNGKKILFKWMDKTCRNLSNSGSTICDIYSPDEHDEKYIDEEKWRKKFSAKLNEKILVNCISQEELSERTGISQVMISKYLNAKATPSFYRIEQIARVLKCSVSELGNIR